MTHKCFLCPEQVETSLCGQCALDVQFLGVEPPDPKASLEELKKWAKDNKVTAFSCGKAATGEQPW